MLDDAVNLPGCIAWWIETVDTSASRDPASALVVHAVEGAWLAKALHAIVVLRIPDLLAAGPRPVEALAAATGAHAPSLHRMLRALAGEGLLAFDDAGCFSLTAAGAVLRSDAPSSLRDWVLVMLGEVHHGAWQDLLHTARTGESAFRHRYGIDLWRYCAEHEDHARLFASAMAGFTTTYIENLLGSYSFDAFGQVVDVGGGDGSLLIAVLKANPAVRGVVLERPEVAARARQRVRDAGLADRCSVTDGDALVEVPGGGDAYLLSRVLHDWDDDSAARILASCRNALASGGRVLVIERLMPGNATEAAALPASRLSDVNMTDLNMMVMTSGRERTITEYRALFARAGLDLLRVVPTRGVMNVMEAARRGALRPQAEAVDG